MVQSDNGSGPFSVRKIEQPAPPFRGGRVSLHGDCRFHVVCSVIRLGIAGTIGPLRFPFRVMVDFHRAVVFASFQVAGSRLQGRLSACVSRLAASCLRFDVPVLLSGAPQFRSPWGPSPDPSAWLPTSYSSFQRLLTYEAGAPAKDKTREVGFRVQRGVSR